MAHAGAGGGKDAEEVPFAGIERIMIAMKVAGAMNNLHHLISQEVPTEAISLMIGKLLDGEERKMMAVATWGHIPISALEATISRTVGKDIRLYMPVAILPGKKIFAFKASEGVTLWHWHKAHLDNAEEEKSEEGAIVRYMPMIALTPGKVADIGTPPGAEGSESAFHNTNEGYGNTCILSDLGDKYNSIKDILDA